MTLFCVPHCSCCSCSLWLSAHSDESSEAVVVEVGASSPCGESSLCCLHPLQEKPKMPQVEPFTGAPGAPPLLLPPVCWSATDGSNCAETNVSQAFIIYSVCCMLLSKVPCGVVSACIFNTSGPTGTMKFHNKPRLMPVFCAQSSEYSEPQQQYWVMISVSGDFGPIKSYFFSLDCLLTPGKCLFSNNRAH